MNPYPLIWTAKADVSRLHGRYFYRAVVTAPDKETVLKMLRREAKRLSRCDEVTTAQWGPIEIDPKRIAIKDVGAATPGSRREILAFQTGEDCDL